MSDFSKVVRRGIKDLSLEADVLICIRLSSGKMIVYPYYECEMGDSQLEAEALRICVLEADKEGMGAAEVWVEDLRKELDAYDELKVEASSGLE